MIVNTTDLDSPGHLKKVQLVSLKGIVLSEYSLQAERDLKNIYRTDAFKPPSGYFYVKVRTSIGQNVSNLDQGTSLSM
jgi:hypothetical protein